MVQRTLEFALNRCRASLKLLPYCGRGRRTGVCSLEAIMKLLRTTALTAALITAAVPLLTSDAQAWRGWRGGGWGWRGAALGAAAVGTALAARSYYGGYGYGYPAYGYGYGTGYSYPSYGYGYGAGYGYPSYGYGYGTGYSYSGYGYGTGIVRRGLYAAAWRRWR